MVLQGGKKMSVLEMLETLKVIGQYGADAVRTAMMFAAPPVSPSSG